MGDRVQPHLIITRPEPDGTRFATQLRAALGDDVSVTLAPLMQIDPIPAQTDAGGFVFTSTNGVARAVAMNVARGPAWCVGDRTAQAASKAGFDAMSAHGNAQDLIELILSHNPFGPIAHIRGRHARGDIAPRLRAAGIECADIIAYEQSPKPLSQNAIDLIEGADPVIIPLFSPRATELLFDQATPDPAAHLIAISRQAACGRQMQIADRPDGAAMLQATLAAFRALND